jgi:lipopolysaccharide transport system ATP-binding protein
MSSGAAILVKNLGKLYHIGASQARYRTFREAMVDALAAPWGLARRAFGAKSDGQGLTNNIIWALKDVDLEVRPGEILGVVGRNGAGKSTLLKVLSRITEPTAGRVELYGRVGSLLEVGTGFHPELTGRENIFLNGAILGMSRNEIRRKFDEIVEFAEIGRFIDTPLKRYSTGMGTRLAFAVAAHLEPEILLVDEVLAVGDIGFRKKCLGKMKDVGQEGRTVVFVSHEMNAIRRLCKSALWLDRGQILAVGEVQDVVRKYESSFSTSDDSEACRVDRDKAPGLFKYFSWLSLASEDGSPTKAFKFGDTMLVNLGMSERTAHHSHFLEWIITDRTQGTRLAWGGSQATREGDIPGDCLELSINIGPLPLAVGSYSISVNMGVPEVAVFDFWHDAITFEITECDPLKSGYNFSTRYAPVHIPYEINYQVNSTNSE